MGNKEKFRNWIEKQGGSDRVAVALDVTSFAVRHWRDRKGYPKIETIRKIVKLSKGELTLSDVIDGTCPAARPASERK